MQNINFGAPYGQRNNSKPTLWPLLLHKGPGWGQTLISFSADEKKNPKKWEMLYIFPHQRFPQGHNHLLAWLQFINPAPLQWKNKNNSIVGTIKSLFLCPSAAGAASSSFQVKNGMNSVKYTPKSFLLPVFYSPELPANMSWKFLIQGKQTLKIPNLRETNSENSQ